MNTAAGVACFALAGCCHELAPDRRPTPTSGWGILTGAADSSSDGVTRSGVEGRIMAIDGRRMCLRANAEVAVAPGCYLVEAEFEYELTRRDYKRPCIVFKAFGACDKFSDYDSGRLNFALPIVAGRRYELSALIGGDHIWTHFVEVDPRIGTVSRFPPVVPGTGTCSSGIPVGDAVLPLRRQTALLPAVAAPAEPEDC